MVEMRDGSDRTWQQFVVGWASGPSMGMDDWVRYDRNTDPTTDNDCLDSGGSESYYYHRDRNTRVVALTDEDGAVVERYEYDAYGNPTITIGDPGGALGFERGAVRHASSVGNPFMHQGLFFVPSLRSYQNRFRQYHAELGRFMQRDPAGYTAGLSLLEYVHGSPLTWVDPIGLLAQDTPTSQPCDHAPCPNCQQEIDELRRKLDWAIRKLLRLEQRYSRHVMDEEGEDVAEADEEAVNSAGDALVEVTKALPLPPAVKKVADEIGPALDHVIEAAADLAADVAGSGSGSSDESASPSNPASPSSPSSPSSPPSNSPPKPIVVTPPASNNTQGMHEPEGPYP
jgi:RHS repeat-associated protein